LNASLDELEEKVKEIEYLYRHDPLRGTPNREKLLNDLKTFSSPVLLLIDINSFKSLNFLYGIDTGNIILKQVYQRLKETFGTETYRVGADEFVVLFEKPKGSEEEIFINMLQDKIEALSERPFSFDNSEILLNFTAVALCEVEESDKIITDAYTLLEETKAKRKSFSCEFNLSERFRKIYEENLYWLEKFREALKEGRILPYYQPIIDNQTRKPAKFEALVRLIEKSGEVISPFKFLTIAQKAGYGPEITKRVLQMAIEDFLFLPYEVSVNLSYNDFLEEGFLVFLDEVLEKRIGQGLFLNFLKPKK